MPSSLAHLPSDILADICTVDFASDEHWRAHEQVTYALKKLREAEASEIGLRERFKSGICSYSELREAIVRTVSIERRAKELHAEQEAVALHQRARESYARRTGRHEAELVLRGSFKVGDSYQPWLSMRLLRELDDIEQCATELTHINVIVNSSGGSLSDGMDLYHALRWHPSRVGVLIEAEASSAAAIVCLAGDHVRMARDARIMLHSCRMQMLGLWTHAELSRATRECASINRMMAGILAERTQLTSEQIDDILVRDVVFDAQQALAAGLAHEIVEPAASA